MTVHSAKGREFPVVILPCLHRSGARTSEPFIDEEIGLGFSPLKPDEEYIKSEPDIVEMMKTLTKNKDEAEKKRLFLCGLQHVQKIGLFFQVRSVIKEIQQTF